MENKDRILHFTLADGAVRGLLIDATETVREAQRLHGTSAVATAALGRALTGTAMLAATLKEPNASVNLTLDGGMVDLDSLRRLQQRACERRQGPARPHHEQRPDASAGLLP